MFIWFMLFAIKCKIKEKSRWCYTKTISFCTYQQSDHSLVHDI
jgi:hypothetical protein